MDRADFTNAFGPGGAHTNCVLAACPYREEAGDRQGGWVGGGARQGE